MSGDLISRKRFVAFRKMGALRGFSPGTGSAGLGIDHDTGSFDKSVAKSRGEAERDTRRVTSGIADEIGLADIVPEQLRQSVNRAFMQLWMLHLTAVPACICLGIIQPKVRAQIDKFFSRPDAARGDFL